MDTAERVRQEMRRFETSLPRLSPLYADRWVVFRDSEVVSVHDTEELAYRAGLAALAAACEDLAAFRATRPAADEAMPAHSM
jgi:hypothetical protein